MTTATHHEVIMAVFTEITDREPALARRILDGMDDRNPSRDQWTTRLAELCSTYVITHNLTVAKVPA